MIEAEDQFADLRNRLRQQADSVAAIINDEFAPKIQRAIQRDEMARAAELDYQRCALMRENVDPIIRQMAGLPTLPPMIDVNEFNLPTLRETNPGLADERDREERAAKARPDF